MPTFLRGAIPTPKHKMALHVHLGRLRIFKAFTPPPYFGVIPKKMSVLGNSTYGDCVSAEEGAAIECYSSECGAEYVVQDQTVIDFARQHNWLNGADLLEVVQAMEQSGMKQGSDTITDGPSGVVDLTDEAALQAAIATGPVKFGMDANALPQGAGNQQAWEAFGSQRHNSEDHCMSFFAYGPIDYLVQIFNDAGYNVQKPTNAPSGILYVPYTWATCGIATHDWILSCTPGREAYIRNPTTLINGKPLVPTPPTPPDWSNIWL